MSQKIQSQDFKIRKATPQDARICAEIHKQEIGAGFLSQLGIDFLELLYKAIISSSNTCCFVAEDMNSQIVGFAVMSSDIGKLYKNFIAKYSLNALLIIIPQLIKPAILRKVIETAIYPFKKDKANHNKRDGKLPETELISIAIYPHIKGTGISQRLMEAIFDECRRINIREIKVVVGAENVSANKFYEKVGFILHSNIFIHENEISNVYVKLIQSNSEN